MAGRTIIIAEPAYLVRHGIVSLVKKMNFPIRIHECDDYDSVQQILSRFDIDLLIINTTLLHDLNKNIIHLRTEYRNLNILGISNSGTSNIQDTKHFDEIIYLNDNKSTLLKKLKVIISIVNNNNKISTSELSEREIMVLKMIAHGMTNQAIADELFISMHTVITHRKNITKKLGIKTVAGLTVYSILNGFIKPEEIH